MAPGYTYLSAASAIEAPSVTHTLNSISVMLMDVRDCGFIFVRSEVWWENIREECGFMYLFVVRVPPRSHLDVTALHC